MSRATHSERNPLLRIQSRQSDAPSFSIADVAPSPFHTTIICLVIAAVQQVAASLLAPAVLSFNEAILCRNVYGHVADPANDARCKAPAVQSQLSILNAFDDTFGMGAAVLASIPIGVAADRYGRRPFLVAAIISGVLNMGSRICICTLFPGHLSINYYMYSTVWEWNLLTFFTRRVSGNIPRSTDLALVFA